jgi:hypothetical protein
MNSYGKIKINSLENKNIKPVPKIDTRTVPPIIPSVSRPKPQLPNRFASFDVELNYKDYKLVIRRNQQIASTNLILEYQKKYKRYVDKNVTKDIKEFVLNFTSKKQASHLRKRIIALEKFGSVDEKQFRFKIE